MTAVRDRTIALLATPWIAGALVALAARAVYLGDIVQYDSGLYLTFGSEWLHGTVPYRDLLDQKGPVAYGGYALVDLITPERASWVRMAFWVLFSISVWQLAALTERHAGRRAAWLVAVLWALIGTSTAFEGPDTNTEHLSFPLLIGCIDLADRYARRPRAATAIGAGAALVALALVKPVYGLIGFLVLAIFLTGERRVRGVALSAAGGIAVLAVPLIGFAAIGALDDLYDVVWTYNRTYVNEGYDGLFSASMREQIAFWLSYPVLGYALAAGALGLAAWRLGPEETRAGRHRLVRIAVAWWFIGLLVAKTGGRDFWHYQLTGAPSLALLGGVGLAALAAHSRRPQLLAAAVLTAAASGLVVAPALTAATLDDAGRTGTVRRPQLEPIQEIGETLRAATTRDDRIWLAAEYEGESVYWYADRRPASKYIYPRFTYPEPTYDEVSRDLVNRRTGAIVVMPGSPTDYLQPAIRRWNMQIAGRYPVEGGSEVVVYARPDVAARIRETR